MAHAFRHELYCTFQRSPILAFIAGYVAERPQPTEAIHERVRGFSILPGKSGSDYVQAVITTPSGHLIAKHKATYPIRPQIASDAEGNVLVTLGFVLSDDAEALLSLALRTAGRSLEECEGEFVVVFVEAASRTVHVVNDRFSSRPLYTVRRDDGIYFSSNLAFLLTLARAPYRPDVVGWLEVGAAGPHTRDQNDGGWRAAPSACDASDHYAGAGEQRANIGAWSISPILALILPRTAQRCFMHSARVLNAEDGSSAKEPWR